MVCVSRRNLALHTLEHTAAETPSHSIEYCCRIGEQASKGARDRAWQLYAVLTLSADHVLKYIFYEQSDPTAVCTRATRARALDPAHLPHVLLGRL